MEESVSFDRFELHPAARMLLADGAPVPVGGRAFDVLCMLVEFRNRVVGKSEVLDRVWKGRAVEENNLTVQISKLREVLGPTVIVTVASQGYRFARPVRRISDASVERALAAVAELPVPADHPSFMPAEGLRESAVGYGEQPVIMAVLGGGGDTAVGATDPHTAAVHSALDEWLRRSFTVAVQAHGGIALPQRGLACLAEFATARAATGCAIAMQDSARQQPWARSDGLRMALVPRASYLALPATNSTVPEVSVPHPTSLEDADIALAMQLAGSAPAGETRAAAAVRDNVTDAVDCHIEDLGDLSLMPGESPLRAYRVQANDGRVMQPERFEDAAAMKPLIAVVPFESRQNTAASLAIGELIADGLIGLLSHARHSWRVVSRLSATAFRGRGDVASEAQSHLGAAYVVSGSYVEQRHRLIITLQVADSRSGEVARVLRLDGTVADLLTMHSELLEAMFCEIQRTVYEVELQRVYSAPVPTLQSYTLLLGGIQLLHRSTPRDFDLSFRVLAQLAQCHPHAPEPRIWQAKWYAMRAVQGQSADLSADAKAALACTGAALAIDANNAFALAMEGFVHAHLTRDYSAARERLQGAILQNDSETFAHLFNGVVLGLMGNFSGGLASYEVALSTSPRDPARYLMDSIGAYLYLACGRQEAAIRVAKDSLRQNRNHAHTWRIITVAQQEAGALDDARQSLRRVLELQPGLTVDRYLAGARPGDPVRHRFAEALHRAGLPVH